MHEKDLRPDFADAQPVDTYTIGFGTTATDDVHLKRVADVGGGLFFHAQDGSALAASVLSALNDIIEQSRSINAATVPSACNSYSCCLYYSFIHSFGSTSVWVKYLHS